MSKKKEKKGESKRQKGFVEYIKANPQTFERSMSSVEVSVSSLKKNLGEFQKAVSDGSDVYGINIHYIDRIHWSIQAIMIQLVHMQKVIQCASDWRESLDQIEEMQILMSHYNEASIVSQILSLTEGLKDEDWETKQLLLKKHTLE